MKSLKQIFAATCLAFFVLLVSSQSVLAQETKQPKEAEDETPSLKETFDWLKSKLEGFQSKYTQTTIITRKSDPPFTSKDTNTTSIINFKESYSNFTLDNCSMTWTQEWTLISQNSPESRGTEKYKVNLSEIDPLNIKIVQLEPDLSWIVYDKKSGTTSPDTWKVKIQPLDEKTKTPDVGINFQDREMAKRVAKAFQNAVKKCGGKVEPF